MLYAYMDPSGTHLKSPVLSIFGFVANEDAWRAFDKAWRMILDNRFGLRVYLGFTWWTALIAKVNFLKVDGDSLTAYLCMGSM